MDGIKIEVTGNIARVIGKPSRITSGTVGLTAEFTFDSQWEYLKKLAVFQAGDVIKTIELSGAETIVPWEVMAKPGVWLSVGVYGVNEGGSIVIPTIWANVCGISLGVNPDGDPTTDPTPSLWQTMMDYISTLIKRPAARVSEVVLLASAWEGEGKLYSQVVALDGITQYSQVDLKPSAEQLTLFHEKDIAFSTENEDGIVTVYVVGDKPTKDYTIQVSITETEVVV